MSSVNSLSHGSQPCAANGADSIGGRFQSALTSTPYRGFAPTVVSMIIPDGLPISST